jgi:hypothetical protein
MKNQMAGERKRKAMWPQIFMAMVVLAFASIRPCIAADDSVQDLYDLCRSQDEVTKFPFCVAYIAGVGETMQLLGRLVAKNPELAPKLAPFAICKYPSNGAMIQAFKNWAEANPQKWATAKISGVMIALDNTWPCT